MAIGVFRERKQGIGQGYTLNVCLELRTKKVPATVLLLAVVSNKESWLYVALEVVIVFGCKCCRYIKELQAFISKIYTSAYYFFRMTRKGSEN